MIFHTIILVLFCGIVIVLLLQAFIIVPTYHYGVVTRFSRRTGRCVKEGLRIKIPLIDEIELYDAQIKTTPVSVVVNTEDKQDITVYGSLKWQPDIQLMMRYTELSEDTLKNGIIDSIKSTLGEIAGNNSSSSFTTNLKIVELLINCTFRLETPPHLRSGTVVIKKDILDYYDKRRSTIDFMLKNDEKHHERSPFEERYGIHVVIFDLSDIKLPEKTQASLEKRKQADADTDAAETRMRRVEIQAAKLIEKGVDPQAAILTAAKANGIEISGQIYSGAMPIQDILMSVAKKIGGGDTPKSKNDGVPRRKGK
ncbi:MAG: hypothetical protein A2586_00305 [Candidatus Harrisonbacteria bacterium RIFOXYD1_FULL_40_9]|uniref:Band 7 domain-containing protein n=1 Tax=Candidatus Harrisonbacteria bacterium RIFOXYD1_FULL_40_9 TaxID=1798412 RepID=A0A1G2A019_9BACT|nr:MAG: hypothetical protein A2586_00305 [Candidatus Harrisonbacteria bacterium RIFOXYD1_FULL_40_9]